MIERPTFRSFWTHQGKFIIIIITIMIIIIMIIIMIKRIFIQDKHFNNYNIAVIIVCPVP